MNELYRYVNYSELNFADRLVPVLKLEKYHIIKETEKGQWISDLFAKNHKRWISKTAKKRFAYPTLQEALFAFKKRKECHIKILESQLHIAKDALVLAKNYKYEE